MARKHRTQVLLERQHYYHVRSRAEAEGRSISDIIRELVAADIASDLAARAADPLWGLIGMAEGGPPYDTSERVDEFLYGGPDGTPSHTG